ncbi:enoyl-CoA hydratase/isomerase family protein [Neobacillus drentensis]|uniref:enoyl-CoA hydratase/isomerase family protein n=1 Tax=Neobacillus drentensis TaxID=220684 RepID=UPI00082471BB|nr:enoyl-CoA hydratase-related protein [Neobacillus drentensis]
MLDTPSVKYELNEGIAIITLNEPDSLNALSADVKSNLLKCVNQVESDPEVKIVIITGEGKAFSAGGDVKGMGKRTTLESVEKINHTTKLILRIAELQKPVIAAVNGYAMGAGFSLALAADIVIAQTNSKFGLSFSKVGLIPDCGLLHFLPKIVGPWKAKEWIFSGAVLSAEEAQKYGIVNRLVEEGEALNEAVSFAKELARGPVQTMVFVKSIMEKFQNNDLKATIQYENFAQAILQQTEDHLEAVLAFKEKRKPNFTGK